MDHSPNVFKTQQDLRKHLSELQDVLPEFGIHLISIHWGKINKILRWAFLLLHCKSKISPPAHGCAFF